MIPTGIFAIMQELFGFEGVLMVGGGEDYVMCGGVRGEDIFHHVWGIMTTHGLHIRSLRPFNAAVTA